MTTLEMTHHQNGTTDSLDSDYSIIPEIPLDIRNQLNISESITNGSLDVDLHSAMLSATPDLSLEELRSSLIEVCEDNASLKGKIKVTNEMLASNLKAINEWHSRITDSMSHQQIELKESQEQVAKLEKENSELNAKIKELENKQKMETVLLNDEEIDFEIVNRKKQGGNDEKTEELPLKNEIGGLKHKVEYLQGMFEELKKEYSDEAIKTRFMDLPAELLEFLEKLSELGSALYYENFQPQGNKEKVQYSEAVKLYQERLYFYRILCCKVFKQLKDKMEELEQLVKTTKSDLEEEKVKHLDTQKMCNQVQTNYNRVTALLQMESKSKREEASVNNEIELERKAMLEQIDKINAELFETQKKLSEKEKEVASLTSELSELKKTSSSLWKVQGSKNEETERERKAYLEQINNVTADLFKTQQMLLEKENEVASLTSELNKLKEEASTIPIMKSQIDVYECDINNLNLARVAALEEVNNLSERVKELSSVSLCDSCGGRIYQAEGSSKGKGKKKFQLLTTKPKQNFPCPICEHEFQNVEELETHVYDCIDKSEQR